MNLTALFIAASLTYGIPQGLLEAICYVESNHNPMAVTHRDGGSASLGICQVKYKTARFMGFKGQPNGLLKPEVNIEYAAKYLSYQLKRYKGNYAKAITAYNKGSSTSHGGSEYLTKVFNYYVSIQSNKGGTTDSTASARTITPRPIYPYKRYLDRDAKGRRTAEWLLDPRQQFLPEER